MAGRSARCRTPAAIAGRRWGRCKYCSTTWISINTTCSAWTAACFRARKSAPPAWRRTRPSRLRPSRSRYRLRKRTWPTFPRPNRHRRIRVRSRVRRRRFFGRRGCGNQHSGGNRAAGRALRQARHGQTGRAHAIERVRFRINARLVDVNVVALDKKGHPITGLKPEDFEVYDNGVKQKVRSFGQRQRRVSRDPTPQCLRQRAGSAHVLKPRRKSREGHAPPRATRIVLLIDGSNLA